MIIKIVLDKRRATRNGEYPVKIRFAAFGKSTHDSIGLYAKPEEFDEESGLFILTNKATKMNNAANIGLIKTWMLRAQNALSDALQKGINITPDELKKTYKSVEESIEEVQEEIESFSSYFKRFTAEKEGRTRDIYITTMNKLSEYYGNEIEFKDINYAWLMDFDKRMQKAPVMNGRKQVIRKGIEANSRSIHFRNIRAAFNRAIDEELIGIELYPFRRFKIPHEKTAKRAVSVDKLRKLFAFAGTPDENWAVDMAKFVFMLIGINIKDLYLLEEYDGDYIYYSRAKTKRPYSIKVEPELKPLFDKYKGKNSLLQFKEQFYLHVSMIKKINNNLAEISKSIGSTKITTYTLRHTWATIAAELDIPKETIAASLGHAENSVTDIYINFNRKKIDEANRKIIDHVFEK